jgi:hypothetical protein
MRVSDLDSAASAYRDLLAALEAATTSRNWTAVAALSRLRLDVQGMLRSSNASQSMTGISDDQLLTKLAGDNVELRKQLQGLLGSDSFPTAKPEPTATINSSSGTKH